MRHWLITAIILFLLTMGGVEICAQPDLLTITSPPANANVSTTQPLHISWQSMLAGNITYCVSYLADGQKITEPVAEKTAATECDWTPRSQSSLWGSIKIKALDENGTAVAEQSVDISFVPKTAIVVSKANQKVYYFSEGELRNVFTCSTARPKYDLEPGQYAVYSREMRHWSRKYEVWMPHSLFFHEGYALHATTMIRELGRPASHGCVRLHPRDAKTLFGEVKVGTPVLVLPKTRDCTSLLTLYKHKQLPPKNVIVAADRQN